MRNKTKPKITIHSAEIVTPELISKLSKPSTEKEVRKETGVEVSNSDALKIRSRYATVQQPQSCGYPSEIEGKTIKEQGTFAKSSQKSIKERVLKEYNQWEFSRGFRASKKFGVLQEKIIDLTKQLTRKECEKEFEENALSNMLLLGNKKLEEIEQEARADERKKILEEIEKIMDTNVQWNAELNSYVIRGNILKVALENLKKEAR